jgi:hypothetical protein
MSFSGPLAAAFPYRAEGRLLRNPFSEPAQSSHTFWPGRALNRPRRSVSSKASYGIVTSATTRTASGWNDQLPGGIRTHKTSTPFHGARPEGAK